MQSYEFLVFVKNPSFTSNFNSFTKACMSLKGKEVKNQFLLIEAETDT